MVMPTCCNIQVLMFERSFVKIWLYQCLRIVYSNIDNIYTYVRPSCKHWNGNIILTKFSSLAALEVVILLTFNAVRGEDSVKIISTFLWSEPVIRWQFLISYEDTFYHLENRGADSRPLRKCLYLLTSAKLSSQNVSVIYYSSPKQSSIQYVRKYAHAFFSCVCPCAIMSSLCMKSGNLSNHFLEGCLTCTKAIISSHNEHVWNQSVSNHNNIQYSTNGVCIFFGMYFIIYRQERHGYALCS